MRGAVQLQTVSLSTYICAGGHCCASNTRTSATPQPLAVSLAEREKKLKNLNNLNMI